MSLMSRVRAWWLKPVAHRPIRRPSSRRLKVESLEGRDLPSAALPLHLDLGTATSAAQYGYTGVGIVAYDAGRGYGWADTTSIQARNRRMGSELTRDFQQGRDGTYLIDLPNGTYSVTLTLGDAFYHREGIDISAQGQSIVSGLTTGRNQFVRETFQVQVANGRLTISLHDGLGNYKWALNGIDVTPVSAAPAPTQQPATQPTASSPTIAPSSPTPSLAAGLYVSTHGSDSNNGSAPSTALRNIATALQRVQPGETIYVEGGTYYEHLVTSVAGAPGQVITLTSYNGTAIVDGSNLNWTPGANQNIGVIELRQPYYKLEGIEVLHSPDTGIVLGASHLTIDSSTIAETQRHAISTDTKYQLVSPGKGFMIGDITLTNNNVYHAVIKGQGYGQAISLIADGFTVDNNVVHNNYTEGIDIWLGSRHGEVAGNNVYSNQKTGIYVDGASYLRIDRNQVYDGAKDGIGVSSENPNYSTHDIWVYNNVVHDNAAAGLSIWDSSTNPGYHGSQNVLLADNTLDRNHTNIYLAGDSNTAQIMNNLGYTTGKELYNSATNSSFNIHNNVWQSNENGFVSAGTNDFHLNSSSPAINQGSPLPVLQDDLGNTFIISTDYDGKPRVIGLNPDAGAYEYQG